MPCPYSSLDIANTFIRRHGESGTIDHMKIQKLTYYSYGWWLTQDVRDGKKVTPLTKDKPEVWRFGPVFAKLYEVFKYYGRDPLVDMVSDSPFKKPEHVTRDRKVIRLIDWVWERYGGLASLKLSEMTHDHGTAWRRMAEEHDYSIAANTPIPDDYIRAEFTARNV